MKQRPLGQTGIRVSEIGFGCGPTAGLMLSGDRAAQEKAVGTSLDLGITYFDTAPGYGDGVSEKALGDTFRALKARPVIATKIALEESDFGDMAAAVERSIDKSLSRLSVDHLDVVHIHNRVGPARAARAEYGSGAVLTADDFLGDKGVVETLERCRTAGKIGAIGCCGFGGTVPELRALVDSGRFGSILVNYSLLNISAWEPVDVVDRDYGQIGARAAAKGMGTIGLRTLEAGVLATPDAADPHLAPIEFLRDNGTFVAPAIRFALANTDISSVLIGFSNLAQIEQSAEIAALGPLPQEDLERLATLMP